LGDVLEKEGWWRKKTERPENVDLWQRLDALCQTHEVEFRWVKGHAGNLENERCDQLAMVALRQPNLQADEGYENKPETEGVRPDMQEGEPCRKCSTPVIKRKGKSKPNRDYYCEYHLWCPSARSPTTLRTRSGSSKDAVVDLSNSTPHPALSSFGEERRFILWDVYPGCAHPATAGFADPGLLSFARWGFVWLRKNLCSPAVLAPVAAGPRSSALRSIATEDMSVVKLRAGNMNTFVPWP